MQHNKEQGKIKRVLSN